MEPIRWGILGAGVIADLVGADIASSPGSEIVAVAARDASRERYQPVAALDAEEGRLADAINLATDTRSWELWKQRVTR